MSVEYYAVEDEHVTHLAANMRQADIDELSALTDKSREFVIRSSVATSSLAATAFINGQLAAILGVCPAYNTVLNTKGVPWLLGTPVITENKKLFCSQYKAIINQMLEHYSELENFVDSRNK